jgi:NitT/TauT family transport system substrate-binding protein
MREGVGVREVRAGRLSLLVALGVLLWGACAPTPARPAGTPTGAASVPGGAGATTSAAVGTPSPLVPAVAVRGGILGILVDAGLLIAAEKGYFRDEGLDVGFETFRSSSEQIPLLATGDLQFGTGAIDPALFNGVARDVGIRIVAQNSSNSPSLGAGTLVARQELYDSGALDTMAKLKGHTVGVSTRVGTPGRYVEIALERGGLTEADIEWLTIPFPDMPAALANGSIDAAWMNEPFATLSLERGFARQLATAAELWPTLVTDVLMFSDRFAQDQPEAARRFVTAHLRAQRDYYRAFVQGQDPALRAEIVRILVERTNVKDPALYDRMALHAVDPNGAVDPAIVAEVQDWFASKGVVQVKIDPERIVDRQYLDYALQRLGRIN